MSFLLARYWARPRHTCAGDAIRCPEALVRDLAQNSLEVADTVTNGNCGVHAFGLSLADGGKHNKILSSTYAFKEFRAVINTNTEGMIAYLRKRSVDAMVKIKNHIMWEGMEFKQLALSMSSEKESFDAYLTRMAADGVWLDASAIHALATSFKVDVLVWQQGMDQTILGHSLTPGASPALGVINIVMVNDLHYWGIQRIREPCLVVVPDTGDFLAHRVQVPGASKGDQVDVDDADDDADPEATAVETTREEPSKNPPAVVELELGLCALLSKWNPWVMPDADVIHHLQSVAEATTNIDRDPGNVCLLRQRVLQDMLYEREHFDTMPARYKYNAIARWRLRCDVVCSTKHQRAKVRQEQAIAYVKTAQAISKDDVETRLLATCSRGKNAHLCFDTFRSNPNIVRNWRVLWHSLPAGLRRESLMVMFKTMINRHGCGEAGVADFTYPFLGYNVCRTAFRCLTGIGSSSLSSARAAAIAGHESSLSRSELGMCKLIRNTNKDKLYLDARCWLEHYADRAGDHSPMDVDTFLPKGRKYCYWAFYAQDRKPGPHAALSTFCEAWRTELPWLKVASSLSKLIHCGVCDYLKDLIDKCPRSHSDRLSALVERLGSHYSHQSAQRLAQDRLAERCDQSQGKAWAIKIDKMDCHAIWLPTKWSMMNTSFFREGKRLQVSLIGSWWSGLSHSAPIHLRTVFDDLAETGSEMQFSTLMLNLHEKAVAEKHLPEELSIGADNTVKETKNSFVAWAVIWLLCVLADTPMWSVLMTYLLVGHTHDKIDRFFSRVKAAVAGRDYYTMYELFELLGNGLPAFNFTWSHLHTVWNWKALASFDIPPLKGLARVHAVNFYRNNGIWVKWKQYMTSEQWSRPVLLIPPHEMASLAAWRPDVVPHAFGVEAARSKLAWLDKFESMIADTPGALDKHRPALRHLRDVIAGTLPEFTSGVSINELIDDLKMASTGQSVAQGVQAKHDFPADVLAQYFPSADHPPMPADTLINIPRRWDPPAVSILMAGAMVVTKAPPRMTISYANNPMDLPFLVGMVVECANACVVALEFWLPPVAPISKLGGGKKRTMPDLFGAWVPFGKFLLADAERAILPDILVNVPDILEVFEFDIDGRIPFCVLDRIRDAHGLDIITSLSMSQTHLGNIYRTHVLTRPS